MEEKAGSASAARRINRTQLLTHTFTLDRIAEAYELFSQRRDGVLKVAVQVE
jgi:alcohol dehydrogenase